MQHENRKDLHMSPTLPYHGPAPDHVPPELMTDFSLNEHAGINEDPYGTLAQVASSYPRLFYTTRNNQGKQPGSWILTRAEDLRYVLRHPQLFSSQDNSGFAYLVGESWGLVPLDMDAPRHTAMRAWLVPIFAPTQVERMERAIRQTCVELIEKFRSKGETEFMESFGRPFPVTVVLTLMGLPLEALPRFLQWEHELLHSPEFAVKARAARQIKDYLLEAIADRRRSPRDDLFTKAVQHRIKGEPLSDDEVLGFCYLMFVGGLDTVAASLGFHYKHLAEHPELQERLRRDPALIPQAVDELLRRYALVTGNRRVVQDTEVAGVKLKAGDWISVTTPFASIDAREYPDPLTVDLDRANKSHMTFVTGPHVCLGMHLARRELIIALEEWTRRLPVFRIKPGTQPRVHAGGVFGVDDMRLAWDI